MQTHSEDEKIEDMKVPPKMTVSLVATDMLHLTMTKSCLDLLTKLGDVRRSLCRSISSLYFSCSKKRLNRRRRK